MLVATRRFVNVPVDMTRLGNITLGNITLGNIETAMLSHRRACFIRAQLKKTNKPETVETI
jgi:hypothetical protein